MKVIAVALGDEALASPLMHGGLGDAKTLGDFFSRQHAAIAQPLTPAWQVVGGADVSDLLEVEGLAFPCPKALLVEDIADLTIAVLIEKPVDFGDQLRLELADLGDG